MNDIANASTALVRRFRFLLSADHLSSHHINSFRVDWVKGELSFEAYEWCESGSVAVHDWCHGMLASGYPDEAMTFTTLDGCGVPLYKHQVFDITVTGMENSFDMASNEPALMRVTVKFSRHTHSTTPQWSLRVGDASFPIQLESRPQVDIEEVEGPKRSPIPGRATWLPVEFITANKNMAHINWLDPVGVNMTLERVKDGNVIERWGLIGAWACSIRSDAVMSNARLRYERATYERPLENAVDK